MATFILDSIYVFDLAAMGQNLKVWGVSIRETCLRTGAKSLAQANNYYVSEAADTGVGARYCVYVAKRKSLVSASPTVSRMFMFLISS